MQAALTTKTNSRRNISFEPLQQVEDACKSGPMWNRTSTNKAYASVDLQHAVAQYDEVCVKFAIHAYISVTCFRCLISEKYTDSWVARVLSRGYRKSACGGCIDRCGGGVVKCRDRVSERKTTAEFSRGQFSVLYVVYMEKDLID